MPRSLSLLERLGGKKQEPQPSPERPRLSKPADAVKHHVPQKQEYTEKQVQQEREAAVEASAFAGRRALNSHNDVMK